jgi:hypothetical protein
MFGAKGSIRDASIILMQKDNSDTEFNEFVLTVGCDRFLRIYDPTVLYKR